MKEIIVSDIMWREVLAACWDQFLKKDMLLSKEKLELLHPKRIFHDIFGRVVHRKMKTRVRDLRGLPWMNGLSVW